ncbi:MAG: hypothetical protein JXB49_31245 [Bacteroidales bacterium]|nr:hypothetical protein [Bacteroidales bacterium]
MKNSELLFGLMASFNKGIYSFDDLYHLFKPFDIAETILRTTLSRMHKKEQIIIDKRGREAFYSLSRKGNIISRNVAYSFHSPDWKKWDNSWWGITYSMPNNASRERYQLIKKMTAYRFAMLNAGFWIRPYNKHEDIDKVFNNSVYNKYIKLLRFSPSGDFSIKEVQEAWKIHEINRNLIEASSLLTLKMNGIERLTPEKALFEKMITGEVAVSALFTDPLLPLIYFPKNWKGEELRKKFQLFDKRMTEISKPYWSIIFKKGGSSLCSGSQSAKNLEWNRM